MPAGSVDEREGLRSAREERRRERGPLPRDDDVPDDYDTRDDDGARNDLDARDNFYVGDDHDARYDDDGDDDYYAGDDLESWNDYRPGNDYAAFYDDGAFYDVDARDDDRSRSYASSDDDDGRYAATDDDERSAAAAYDDRFVVDVDDRYPADTAAEATEAGHAEAARRPRLRREARAPLYRLPDLDRRARRSPPRRARRRSPPPDPLNGPLRLVPRRRRRDLRPRRPSRPRPDPVTFAVVVATYGPNAWRARGRATADHVRSRVKDRALIGVYSYHDPAGTLATARNHGARANVAEWLVFLDADDEIEPGYIDAFANTWFEGAVLTDWAPLLVPSVRYVHADGRREPPRIPQEGRWPELNECVIGTGIRRDVFLDLGGFRELASLEDYDLWLRAYDAGAPLVYARDAVYRANVNPDGRNRDQSPYDGIWRDHLDRIAA